MNGRLTYGLTLALGVLSLVLLIANIVVITSNRSLQDTVNQRQAEINKGSSLANINRGLTQALAEAAIDSNDTAIKDLLTSQGVTLTPTAKTSNPSQK